MEEEENIRMAGVVRESIVDGPGLRYVIFTQGCPHRCEDCHNPQTHDMNGGKIEKIDNIVEDIKKNPLLRGITLSGGEPFVQAKKLVKLLSKIDLNRYNIIAYTGFEYEYLLKNSNEENCFIELLSMIDILIDGRFEKTLKSSEAKFRGSINQRSIDVKKSLKEKRVIEYEF